MQGVKLLLLLVLGVALGACDDGPGEQAPDPFDPNRLDPGELRVELDGIEYAPPKEEIQMRYNETTQALEITVTDVDVLLTIALAGSGTRATHPLGPDEPNAVVYRIGIGNPIPYSTRNAGGSGSVQVANFSSTSVQGTFSGTLINSDDSSDDLIMTNGRFNLNF